MAVAFIDAETVKRQTLDALIGGGENPDIQSTEVQAAALRRAASFLCPATPRRLARAVDDALEGLPDVYEMREDLVETAESLTAYGDLLEIASSASGLAQRQLYLGPPGFVRTAQAIILIGIRPDAAALIEDPALSARVQHLGHARMIRGDDGDDVAVVLLEEGLTERSRSSGFVRRGQCRHRS